VQLLLVEFTKLRKSRVARKTTHWHGTLRHSGPFFSVIPAKAGIPLSLATSESQRSAKRTRIIRWIPACAGMAEEGGNGREGFIRWMPAGFLHRLLDTKQYVSRTSTATAAL